MNTHPARCLISIFSMFLFISCGETMNEQGIQEAFGFNEHNSVSLSYDAIGDDELRHVYVENFDSKETCTWTLGRGSYAYHYIADGVYVVEPEESFYFWYSVSNWDAERNFQLECLMKVLGDDGKYYRGGIDWGIEWVDSNNTALNRLSLWCDDRGAGMSCYDNNTWVTTVLPNALFRSNDGYEKITIRKVDDVISFFVNEEYISRMVVTESYSTKNTIGFNIDKNSVLYVENITVSEMDVE